jgi:uncharacterized protein (TIRG00374 family)
MSHFLVKSFQWLLFLFLAAFLFFLAFKGVDLSNFWGEIVSAHYQWVFVSMIFAWFAFFFRAYRWKVLIESLGFKTSLWHAYHAVLIGYFSNFIFPRLGEVLRCAALNKFDKAPVDRLVGTVIVERLFDVLMMGVLTLGFIAVEFEVFRSFISRLALSFQSPDQSFLMLVLLILLLIPVALAAVYFFFTRYYPRNRMHRRVMILLRGISNGLRSAWKLKRRGVFLWCTVGLWFCYFMMTYSLFSALDTTSGLTLSNAVFVLVIASFAFVIPAQGGIGSYHLVVSLGLTLFGITYADGLVYATLAHGSQFVYTLLLGGISILMLFLWQKKSKVS